MPDPREALDVIERFLAQSRQPALQEPGEDNISIERGAYSLELRNGRLMLHAWDATHNLARRVTGIVSEQPGRLTLATERFGGRSGTLLVLDLERPAGQTAARRGARALFREQFRRFLRRRLPDWRVAELTTEPDLHHSLSPAYPRALLRKGTASWAAIAAPARPDAAAVLTYGLIWLEHLRKKGPVTGLILFLPSGHEVATCLRLRWFDPRAAEFQVFVYNDEGLEEVVDPHDHGNLDTRLETKPRTIASNLGTPEAVIEAQVRSHISAIDASLRPEPVYGQVTAFAGVDRGMLDLLAVNVDGRLTVIELKATQDPNLPLQALDYWMRVRWHATRGDFEEAGYFPGVHLTREAPKLLLVAPALEFHPTTETILRYFSSEIEVERAGIGAREFKVMFRLKGAQTPTV
jgi:hypothetical protein